MKFLALLLVALLLSPAGASSLARSAQTPWSGEALAEPERDYLESLPARQRRYLEKAGQDLVAAGFSLVSPGGRFYPDQEQLLFMWEIRCSSLARQAVLKAAELDAPLPERLNKIRRLMALMRACQDHEFMLRTRRQMPSPAQRAARYGFMLDVLLLVNEDLLSQKRACLMTCPELEHLWSRQPSLEQLGNLRHSGRLERGRAYSTAELDLILYQPEKFARHLAVENRQERFSEYLRREDVFPRLEDHLPGSARQVLARGVVEYGLQPGLDPAELHARLEAGWPLFQEETLPNGLRLRRLAVKRPPALLAYIENIQQLREELRRLRPQLRRPDPCRQLSLRSRLPGLAVRLASLSLEKVRPAEITLDAKNGQKLYALTYNSPETASSSRVYHIWSGSCRQAGPDRPGPLQDLAPAWAHFAPLEGAAAVFWSIVQRDNYFELAGEDPGPADLHYPRPVNGRGRAMFSSRSTPEEIAKHLASLSLINLPVAGRPDSSALDNPETYQKPALLPPAPEDVYVVSYPDEVFLCLAALGGRNELERLFGPLDRIWIYLPLEAQPEAPWLELSYQGQSAHSLVPQQGRIFMFTPQTRDLVFLPLVQSRQRKKLARYLGRITLGAKGPLMDEAQQGAEAERIIRLGYASGRYHTSELLEQAGRAARDYLEELRTKHK